MDKTELELKKQTDKMLEKLEKQTNKIKILLETGTLKETLNNLNAYISDCKYFLDKKDFIRAFEAIVYAWGIYETCLHLEIIK